MREQMPTAAWLVDHLRAWLGTEAANALLLRSKRGQVGKGQGAFYMAEVGPDGVLREFGTSVDGWRGEVVDGRIVRVDRHGRSQPAPVVTLVLMGGVQVSAIDSNPLMGPSGKLPRAGNSAPAQTLVGGLDISRQPTGQQAGRTGFGVSG